jgi:hypothetical protein
LKGLAVIDSHNISPLHYQLPTPDGAGVANATGKGTLANAQTSYNCKTVIESTGLLADHSLVVPGITVDNTWVAQRMTHRIDINSIVTPCTRMLSQTRQRTVFVHPTNLRKYVINRLLFRHILSTGIVFTCGFKVLQLDFVRIHVISPA